MKRIVTGVAPVHVVSTSRRITCISQITCCDYDITTRGIDEIAFSTSTLDNVKRVAVKMERMARKTSDVDLDDGPLGIDDVCVLRGVEVTCFGRSAQDREEGWEGGGHV